MSERYTKLFALPENLYLEGSPVIIPAGALLKDNLTGKILVQLKIKSVSDQIIKAIRICITQFDVTGVAIDMLVNQEMLDLAIERNTEFGHKTPIVLTNLSTRSFSVKVTEVIFSDNTIWKSNIDEWESIATPQPVYEYFLNDNELIKQYEIDFETKCNNLFVEDRDLWVCTCGNFNKVTEKKCYMCQNSYESAKNIDVSELELHKKIRIEKEAEIAAIESKQKVELELQERKKKRRKIIKSIMITTIVIAFCTVIALVTEPLMFIFTYGWDVYENYGVIKEGERITFGKYEIDDNLSNGKEVIEWEVLEVENGEALLLSSFALKKWGQEGKPWATSALRAWLNSTFVDDAFSTNERNAIQKIRLNNYQNYLEIDEVFILSLEEVDRYIEDKSIMCCVSTPHASRGAWFPDSVWLLRPRVEAPVVDFYGDVDTSTIYVGGCGVRPAIWINISSLSNIK